MQQPQLVPVLLLLLLTLRENRTRQIRRLSIVADTHHLLAVQN
jgi:hypothetical protein